MKLSMPLMYAGNPREAADSVVALEKAGLDTVWVAEVYGFDSPTLMGYLAAKTETVEIGSAILNVYSRTPALIAQTAAGLDNVSGGRAILGLGASGPQVIEGWHGLPYDKPLGRTREVVDIVRRALRRETLRHDGIFTLPLPPDQGTGLGKPLKMLTKPERPAVPIYVAALGEKNVQGTAEYADGWLPFLFAPEKARRVGRGARRGAGEALGRPRPARDLRGRLGRRGRRRQGSARPGPADGGAVQRRGWAPGRTSTTPWSADTAGKSRRSEPPRRQQARRGALVPSVSDVQPRRAGVVKERIAAFAEAGVTSLQVTPVDDDPAALVSRLKEWVS
jgi:alkanesulfonate monooxygenase SsuD/methylene tetrahydromethanopterin reductase-like flavin-dependent oxidoreductase (luciferase family)